MENAEKVPGFRAAGGSGIKAEGAEILRLSWAALKDSPPQLQLHLGFRGALNLPTLAWPLHSNSNVYFIV